RQKTIAVNGSESLFERASQLSKNGYQEIKLADAADTEIDVIYTDTTINAETANKADRKSTRLNSSHVSISYAVFCLKKKKQRYNQTISYNNAAHSDIYTISLHDALPISPKNNYSQWI